MRPNISWPRGTQRNALSSGNNAPLDSYRNHPDESITLLKNHRGLLWSTSHSVGHSTMFSRRLPPSPRGGRALHRIPHRPAGGGDDPKQAISPQNEYWSKLAGRPFPTVTRPADWPNAVGDEVARYVVADRFLEEKIVSISARQKLVIVASVKYWFVPKDLRMSMKSTLIHARVRRISNYRDPAKCGQCRFPN